MTSDFPNASTSVDLRVNLGPRSYGIHVTSGQAVSLGRHVRRVLDETWAGKSCQSVLVVSDNHLADRIKPHVDSLEAAGFLPRVAIVPAGESSKTLARVASLLDLLVDLKADRHWAVIAIGGGVIGDLAGFVAATYARGLPLVMVPTTLLAQVDSSVGGKVGVNHPKAKNIIGAFHQPAGVWIDTAFLDTLPDRELRCGLAEVIKYGVILDAELFSFVESNAFPILTLEPAAMRHLVARSCELKAGIVERDEREENGLRAILNFGHTVGHAIEAVAGYDGPFLHGEAVAVGMIAECQIAERLGWIDDSLRNRLMALLTTFDLPRSAPGLNVVGLLEAMTRDKKNRGGTIRMVLPRALGVVELTQDASVELVREVLEEMTHLR